MMTMNDKTVKIEVVSGVEGHSLYIDDRRVAGSKPWGGGKTVRSWTANVNDILKALHIDPTPVGYKMSSTTGRDRMMCSKCLKDITEDAVFCKYCGARMDGDCHV